jgi:hypothetical protein
MFVGNDPSRHTPRPLALSVGIPAQSSVAAGQNTHLRANAAIISTAVSTTFTQGGGAHTVPSPPNLFVLAPSVVTVMDARLLPTPKPAARSAGTPA